MADLDRNAIPANADCRGGVFSVFAKIPPPVLSAVFRACRVVIKTMDSRWWEPYGVAWSAHTVAVGHL